MSDTPAAANVLRKVLSGLTDHACRLEWRSDNPMRLTDTYKEGEGHHTWTEWEIEQFRATYPLGHRCGRSDITGHRKAPPFAHYRAKANRATLADAALGKVAAAYDGEE